MMSSQPPKGSAQTFQIRWLIWLGIVLLLLLMPLAGQIQARQSSATFAGLVVDFGNGSVETVCIDLGADGTASGKEVLDASGLAIQTARSTGGNEAVCKIEDAGCEQPSTSCFCQCRGSNDCTYWAYYHREAGAWTYDSSSPERHTVRAGDVEGWSWGQGVIRRSGTPPPAYTFEEICAAQIDEPTATATSAPTAPPPQATSTPRPTTTPPPQATATPRPTSPPANNPPPTTATPTAMPDAAMLTCAPNSTTLIEGTGPPQTELLLSFAGRTVGGGTSNAAGNYRLSLALGREPPDDYPVQITIRHSGTLVRQFLCRVPEATANARP
jgi:hypothetical protein